MVDNENTKELKIKKIVSNNFRISYLKSSCFIYWIRILKQNKNIKYLLNILKVFFLIIL